MKFPVLFFVVLLFFCCRSIIPEGTTAPPVAAKTLYNASGGVLGYIDSGNGRVAVRNSGRTILGYVDKNSTYDKSRKCIAKSRLPGLLF